MVKEIIIKPSFDVNSTIKVTLHVLFGDNKSKIIFFLILFGVSSNIISNIILNKKQEIDIYSFLMVIFFLTSIIFFSYRGIKKKLLSNPRLKENIFYILNNEYFQEKGDSFEIKHYWKNIVKVVEKKDFFLIYIAKNAALFIRKIDLKENQYDELKELFNSLDIKKSLK